VLRTYSCIFFLIGAFQISYAQKITSNKMARTIKKIEAFQGAAVAISVMSLKTGKKKVFFNDDKNMTPASNTKLLTFLGTLETFDSLPALAFFKASEFDVHIKTTGYPALLHPFYEDSLLTAFFERKERITYHPLVEHYESFGSDWVGDDFPYYFSAEKSPFPIYGNVVAVTLDSIKQQLQIKPPFFSTFFEEDSSDSFFKRKQWKNSFSGNPKKWSVHDTVYSPFITSDSLFTTLLSKRFDVPVNISFSQRSDTIVWEKLYTNQEELLFKALLQDSDNLIAESLLQMIALEKTNTLNPQEAIDQLLFEWRDRLPDALEWVDGSGLSRYNMITPRTIVAILARIYKNTGWKKIETYFPQDGVSGTLKNLDFKNLRVYAKTGTLRHNHNLSGFFKNKEGEVHAFSIMVNHHLKPKSDVQKGIRSLLEYFGERF